MRQACATDADRANMVQELERWIRWNRVPALWLTFVFQLALNGTSSTYTITAKRLFDSRININDDMGLLSLEDAFVTASRIGEQSPNQEIVESALAVAGYIRKIYLMFRNWYSTRPYSTIEPLSEHLYNLRVTLDLLRSFPELKLADTVKPEPWKDILNSCGSDEFYLRIIARRFAGWAFEKSNRADEGLEQYKLGLSESLAVGLETETCHLVRYAANILRKSGRFDQAELLLRNALPMESHLELSYWQGLSARELGRVLLEKGKADGEANDSMDLFNHGRDWLDETLASSHLPVGRAVREQIGRSYADDAIELARTTSPIALISEMEAAGPRYATDVVIESILARQLSAAEGIQFRKDRADFARHRTLFVSETDDDDRDFLSYAEEIKRSHTVRDRYVATRRRLGPQLVTRQMSSGIAGRAAQLEMPNLVFVLFHLAESRTYAVLLDSATHAVAQQSIEVGMEFWRESFDSYHVDLAAALASSMRRNALLESAVDRMLTTYQKVLQPLLEPMLPRIGGKHVKILPRLGLSELPMHAMDFGGKRLIELADVSYVPTLGAFLSVHSDSPSKIGDGSCPISAIHDEARTPAYRATMRALRSGNPNGLEVLAPATRDNFLSHVSGRPLFDLFFACHGNYDVDDPRNSSLQFSTTEQVSFASLFSELDMPNCRSVLMGACESGLGRTLVAAEYLGLPLAFLSSGVPYVIGTLWQVTQISSAILVALHYEYLNQGKMSVPQALNAAQRATMRLTQDEVLAWIYMWMPEVAPNWEPEIRKRPAQPFAHPYYWAGFYLTGAA
jgi:CHAT domain-containing protein